MLRRILVRSSLESKLKLFVYNGTNLNNRTNFSNVSPQCINHKLNTGNLTYNHKHALEENLSEEDFLVKIKDDPDVFGSAADTGPEEIDEDDLKEQEFLEEKPTRSQKLSTKQYADIIKSFLEKRKLKEAINVVEIQMLKEDKVKPENYIYNLIIGACGRVGYTKKAFSLYNEMKRRGLKITPGTYTALFNACANSPWPTTDGLTRARHLRTIMIEKMYEPNLTNYNAMIKAFGRCGDLEAAFALVDEMTAKKFLIKDDTLNFLLQACITDKEAGFRHALLVWRKFIQKRIKPSLYTYNLMLRCIRDCGLGDIETTKDIINRLVNKEQILISESKSELVNPENRIAVNKPNLMAKVPHLGNILSLTEVTKPEDRLLLVGGCSNFLNNMLENGCTPDIKTFTQLLDNIPSTAAAEKDLLQALRKNNVKPDIDFFNILIKKRSMRFDYESAKEVLTMFKTGKMKPDLVTYGVLALGCKIKEEALSLLEEMKEAKYRINIEILGAMLTQACYHNNFPYVLQLMEMCRTEEIRPSQKFLEKLEVFKKKCKHISNDEGNPLSKSPAYQKGFAIFKMRYKTWLAENPVEDENLHPWQQYRQTSDTDVRHYKDKEKRTRFKPVHTSLFRQKTRTQNVKVKK